jgi:flavin-dependent dehydrogenase
VSRRYDVVVAGAGPAGSTTARECASRGMSVALLDRVEFPRDKPCGGGVNLRTARLLPFDLATVAERVITKIRISVRQARFYDRQNGGPLTYLTQRRCLDTLLVEKAVEAGASFRERSPVRSVESDGSCVVVRAGSETFACRVLVAADGANGPTARLAGVPTPRLRGIALEGNVAQESYPDEWIGKVGIDVGTAPGGYG